MAKPTCRVYTHGNRRATLQDLGQISDVLDDPGSLVWLDVVDPTPQDMALLQEEFNLHPLAIEDAVMAHERPKIEAYDSYWFLVIQAVTLQQQEIVLHEIAIFVGAKYLVTVRHTPAYPLKEIEKRWDTHPERLGHGGGFLLYTILDTVVDGFFPVAEWFSQHVDELEEDLFAGRAQRTALTRIFAMKKMGQTFRRAVIPMRDLLNPIIRGDLTLFPDEEIVYFRDVYDHAVRVIDEMDSVRDLVQSALDIQLSVTANRQAEVSRQLTIIATIFLPLSFIVGFFGQNFGFMINHITGENAFWGLGIGTEVVAIIAMLVLFRVRGWL